MSEFTETEIATLKAERQDKEAIRLGLEKKPSRCTQMIITYRSPSGVVTLQAPCVLGYLHRGFCQTSEGEIANKGPIDGRGQ